MFSFRCFLLSVGNLHPKYRQSLNSIKLVAMVKSSIISELGMNRILDYIVENIKALESVSD